MHCTIPPAPSSATHSGCVLVLGRGARSATRNLRICPVGAQSVTTRLSELQSAALAESKAQFTMSDAHQNTSATPIGFYGAETLESYQLAPGDYASYATSFTSSQGGNSEHLPSRLPPTPPRSLGGTKPDEDAAPVDAVNRRLSSSSAAGASISSCLPGLIAFLYSSSETPTREGASCRPPSLLLHHLALSGQTGAAYNS